MLDLLKSYVPTKVGIRQFADIILLNLLLILYDDVFFSKDSYFR
nr:MAG TPA: hypothetical protein [Bacteriophage sp.]